jgi:hypothetical protein
MRNYISIIYLSKFLNVYFNDFSFLDERLNHIELVIRKGNYDQIILKLRSIKVKIIAFILSMNNFKTCLSH